MFKNKLLDWGFKAFCDKEIKIYHERFCDFRK